jgi:hypothetical protein
VLAVPFQACGASTLSIRRLAMVALLLILLLLILLFGGLGIFVAKVFFVALVIALIAAFLTGGYSYRRLGR